MTLLLLAVGSTLFSSAFSNRFFTCLSRRSSRKFEPYSRESLSCSSRILTSNVVGSGSEFLIELAVYACTGLVFSVTVSVLEVYESPISSSVPSLASVTSIGLKFNSIWYSFSSVNCPWTLHVSLTVMMCCTYSVIIIPLYDKENSLAEPD